MYIYIYMYTQHNIYIYIYVCRKREREREREREKSSGRISRRAACVFADFAPEQLRIPIESNPHRCRIITFTNTNTNTNTNTITVTIIIIITIWCCYYYYHDVTTQTGRILTIDFRISPCLAQDKGGPSKGGFLNKRLCSYAHLYLCNEINGMCM